MVHFLARIITGGLITISLSALLTFILKSNEKEYVKNLNEEHIIVYLPKVYTWVGIIEALFFAALLIWMIVFPNGTGSLWAGIGLSLFIIMGLVLAVEPLIWKIRFSRHEDFFLYTTGFGRTYQVQYADIVYYKDGVNTLTLRTKRKRFFIDNKATNYQYLHTMILQKGVKKHHKSKT